jgi:ribosomal protein L6P/L9E
LLWLHLDGLSHGFKTTLYVKGKGLRLQLKTRKGKLCIYLKLGYSHKIFLHLPKNCWAKLFGRRRTIRLYSLNYILLRNLILKIRSFYPIGLYKVRGFFVENEQFKIVEGKSRLGSGGSYYG